MRATSCGWLMVLALLGADPAWSGHQSGAATTGGQVPRHERIVRPGAVGPNRLLVDVPLLAGAQPFDTVTPVSDDSGGEASYVARGGLGDLRLYDETGREVPYLLLPPASGARLGSGVASASPLRAQIEWESRPSEPGVSRYRLRLPGARLPIVAIELEVGGAYVHRTARVSEARLRERDVAVVPLGSATLRRATRDDVAASRLSIPIQPPEQSRIELVVANGDNAPLELAGIAAVFAELPWIYFEAESTRPLHARFGSPGLPPPTYDLEAARASIEGRRVAEATWGPATSVAPPLEAEAPVAVPATGAPLDVSAFRFRRAIPSGPRGLTALRLDAAAQAHSTVADLRIATPDGRQVPYVWERLTEPLSLDLPPPEPAPNADLEGVLGTSGGTTTVYRIRLPEAGLPSCRLVFRTTSRVFDRSLRLFAEPADDEARGRHRFFQVAAIRWVRSDPEAPGPPLTLEIPRTSSDLLWLAVDEGDNSRLPIEALTLLLPADQLRFFRDTDAELLLLYGAPGVVAPRYDLELIASRLARTPAREVMPGPESDRAAPAGTPTSTRLFWGALIAAVVILAGILARLLRAERPAPGAGAGTGTGTGTTSGTGSS